MKRNQFVFFDSKLVTNATDKATRKALSKFGAFVRRRAKSSIRKRKKISAPGSPPSSHTGKLRKSIYFGYDPKSHSVVVGPLKFGGSNAAGALEHGGISDGKSYRQRPFMKPAFDRELRNIDNLFKNCVKK